MMLQVFLILSSLHFLFSVGLATETECQRERRINAANLKKGALGARLPNCDLDGTYAPNQCGGSKCYCVTKTGRRIQGYSVNVWEADGQDCKCARDEDENEIPGKIFDCDEKGNYKIVACAGYIC